MREFIKALQFYVQKEFYHTTSRIEPGDIEQSLDGTTNLKWMLSLYEPHQDDIITGITHLCRNLITCGRMGSRSLMDRALGRMFADFYIEYKPISGKIKITTIIRESWSDDDSPAAPAKENEVNEPGTAVRFTHEQLNLVVLCMIEAAFNMIDGLDTDEDDALPVGPCAVITESLDQNLSTFYTKVAGRTMGLCDAFDTIGLTDLVPAGKRYRQFLNIDAIAVAWVDTAFADYLRE